MKKLLLIVIYLYLLFGVVVPSKSGKEILDKPLSLKQFIVENDTLSLIKAIKENKLDEVKGLIKKIDVNTCYNNRSILMIASEYSNLQIVKFLLDKGADINTLDTINICAYEKYKTALDYSLLGNNLDIYEFLIKNISRLTLEKSNLVVYLLGLDKEESVLFTYVNDALEKGADPNARDSIGYFSLDLALQSNMSQIFHLLEKSGAHTSLMESIYTDNLDELNSLLSTVSKKNIDITNWDTKYRGAYAYDYLNLRLAILHGFKLSDINQETNNGSRLDFFISAVSINDYEILDLLNFQDPALDWDSCYGETVLTTAVRQRNVKMVKYLLDRGIDKNKREFPACYDDAEEGQNAYEIALEIGDQEIIDLLK